MKRIGFIGLGHMGNPMASNLLKAGFEVHVYDVNTNAYAPLIALGAKPATSIANLTKSVEAIISSVQTSQQVNDICLHDDGIFVNATPGFFYVDCSSIDIEVTRRLHQDAERLQINMLDAPVSGGVSAAQAASLTVMVGGKEKNFQEAIALLSKIGKKVIYAGGPGSGQAAKICNNLLLAISMIGVCEAFALAKKLGLNEKKFFEISSQASGQCWSMTSYCPVPNIIDNVPANRHYQPGFMAKMMLKDLRLAQHAAETADAAIPLGSMATELYELFVSQGHGEMDFSGIMTFITEHIKA